MLKTIYNTVEHTYYKDGLEPIDVSDYSAFIGKPSSGKYITVNGVKTPCYYRHIEGNFDVDFRNPISTTNVNDYGTSSSSTTYRLQAGKYYPYFSMYHRDGTLNINFSITEKNTDMTPNQEIFSNSNLSVLIINTARYSSYTVSFDCVKATINDNLYVGFAYRTINNKGESRIVGNLVDFGSVQKALGDFNVTEYDTDYGSYSSSGGYSGGSFDDSSDTIGIPPEPSLSVSSMGFVNVYRPTANSLNGMVDELFPQTDIPDIPSGETLADIVNSLNGLIDTVANGIIQFGNKNLLDYVLDAHIIPVTPEVSTTGNIKVGYKTLTISAPKVSSDYVTFDCGTLNIKEYYTNYIDYLTSFKLYLPFVGFVPIQPEYVQSGYINVTYRFNVLDGSFCAWVLSTSSKSKLTNTVVGSFSGNCCVHIPISATNYANVISGMVNGVSNTINAVSKGGVGGAVQSSEQTIQSLKPDVALSNGYNATSSYSGIRVPYFIVERPVASFSKNYPTENGLPLNVTKKLSEVKGFTVASNPILNGIGCTDVELSLIKNYLQEGVIL